LPAFAARAAQLVELIIERFELVIGDTPILNGEIVVRDRLLAVALLVVAFGEEIRRQESPDLAVPVHTAAADAGTEQKGAEPAHGQGFLIDVVADGEGVVG